MVDDRDMFECEDVGQLKSLLSQQQGGDDRLWEEFTSGDTPVLREIMRTGSGVGYVICDAVKGAREVWVIDTANDVIAESPPASQGDYVLHCTFGALWKVLREMDSLWWHTFQRVEGRKIKGALRGPVECNGSWMQCALDNITCSIFTSRELRPQEMYYSHAGACIPHDLEFHIRRGLAHLLPPKDPPVPRAKWSKCEAYFLCNGYEEVLKLYEAVLQAASHLFFTYENTPRTDVKEFRKSEKMLTKIIAKNRMEMKEYTAKFPSLYDLCAVNVPLRDMKALKRKRTVG